MKESYRKGVASRPGGLAPSEGLDGNTSKLAGTERSTPDRDYDALRPFRTRTTSELWTRRIKAKVLTSNAEINEALSKAAALDNEPLAESVKYWSTHNVIEIRLTNSEREFIPCEKLQGLTSASKKQLAALPYTGPIWTSTFTFRPC